MVLKFYVLLGHHTKLTHTKFCDKICHILQVMGKMSAPDIKNLGLPIFRNPRNKLNTFDEGTPVTKGQAPWYWYIPEDRFNSTLNTLPLDALMPQAMHV